MTGDKQTWSVGHFMTAQPCTVDHGLSLDDARDRMEANNIRHLLVTRSGRLCGVLSDRDITFATSLPGVKLKGLKVEGAMTEHVYTCEAGAKLQDVAEQMEEHRYGCAVVLDEDYVVGIFTTTDALRAVRTLLAGGKVERRATASHLLDVTAEREKVEHRVRLGDSLRGSGPSARDGLIGTVGLG